MMCKWGTYAKVELCEIDLSGLTREQNKLRAKKLGLSEKGELIDSCIAPLVQMLNDYRIKTIASCCAHGKLDYSVIWIHPKHLKFGQRAYTKTLNKLLIKILSYFVKKLAVDNSQMRLELKFPYKRNNRRDNSENRPRI